MPPFVAEAGVAGTAPAPPAQPSLQGMFRSVAVPDASAGFWRKMLAFAGPGYLVAVGYMDPGNWATDIAGGSAFGYTLLSVVLLSNLMAMLLQSLSAKLGIVTGRDLAQACRDSYGPVTRHVLWVFCEIAIIACDLAEVLGTAIAFKLLFGLPLVLGVTITALDVLLILALQRHGFRKLEAFIIALLIVITLCFGIELALAQPSLAAVGAGLVPTSQILTNPAMLYIAIGILGATVMPHNLYLHSAVVQTRRFERTDRGKREAVKFATIDSTVALGLAFFVNAAILVLAASAFHGNGRSDVAEIQDAYHLLAPLLGAGIASTLFGIALLAAGQNSTITGTLAGQIVMEGFLNIRLPAWLRRTITRSFAIVPAVIAVGLWGDGGAARLLVFSQVVLSLQLPFAVVPLVRFTSDPARMGSFANRGWIKWTAFAVTATIIGLNLLMLSYLP
ncbi:Nramp family divalent metal transporter [Sphingomonas psychrotolerans]|uniref:Divalent metal cation transporter MntH n=1 Tax=Sphingomonas psychrotolerans TaxID=1327635 RepID=A0ABU3N7W1_9SPHN|nr:Nramp family divalent metal transporter [Sphingomonas psychrotolerans]MDT8760589.1 Nramp family divalent metal transporter [Sphingomonas psychrotolerans]